MTYRVATGSGGVAGWRMLNRTAALQRAIVAREPALTSQHQFVRSELAHADSASKLVGNYRLLRTALEAHGLEGDLSNKQFIRKVLESDLDDPKSLANRLSDKRYAALARDFGYGGGATSAPSSEQIDDLLERHLTAVFESRVGETDEGLRLAMHAKTELSALASSASTDATKWYTVIGSAPLRKVVDAAFGFTSAYARLPVDRQLQEYRAAAAKMLGTSDFSVLQDPATLGKLIDRFLIRNTAEQQARTADRAAFTLLLR